VRLEEHLPGCEAKAETEKQEQQQSKKSRGISR